MPPTPPGPPTFPSEPFSNPAIAAPVPGRRLTTVGGKLAYELDANGRWKGGDPIDQGVALSLGVPLGGIPSAPQIGNELHKVQSGDDSTAGAVRDAVLRSYPLSQYLEQGLVETVSIRHEDREFGGLNVEYTYKKPGSDVTAKAFYRPNS